MKPVLLFKFSTWTSSSTTKQSSRKSGMLKTSQQLGSAVNGGSNQFSLPLLPSGLLWDAVSRGHHNPGHNKRFVEEPVTLMRPFSVLPKMFDGIIGKEQDVNLEQVGHPSDQRNTCQTRQASSRNAKMNLCEHWTHKSSHVWSQLYLWNFQLHESIFSDLIYDRKSLCTNTKNKTNTS